MLTKCLSVGAMLLVGLMVAPLRDSAAADIRPNPQELVIGDWYEVSTKVRDDDQKEGEPIHGILVKATDDWMVLGIVLCEVDQESRFPLVHWLIFTCIDESILEETPWLANLLFSKLLIKEVPSYSKSYFWLRRDNTKIVRRETGVHPNVKVDFKNDVPTLKTSHENASCSVVYVEGKKVFQSHASRVVIEGGELAIIGQEARLRVIEDPFWSHVPIVRNFFNGVQIITREVVGPKFPLGNVSYICQNFPYEDRAKRHEEKQAAN